MNSGENSHAVSETKTFKDLHGFIHVQSPGTRTEIPRGYNFDCN